MTTTLGNRHLGVTFPRVVRSEWIKFRTVRSPWWSVGIAVAFTIAFALVLAAGFTAEAAESAGGTELADDLGVTGGGIGMGAAFSTMGIQLSQIAIIALGVLTMTGEYSTGMIRSSLVAVPRRLPVLLGKAISVGIVGLVAGATASFGAFFSTMPILAGTVLQSSLNPEVIRMLAGGGLYLAGIGVLSLALGAIIRSAAGAMGAAFGLLFLVPSLAMLLPGDLPQRLVPFFPAEAGQRLMLEVSADAALGPWAGLAVLLTWALGSLAIAAVLLHRKDA
ncbi:MAG: ABC transporter permease subunit [Homoserinimonas sp.]